MLMFNRSNVYHVHHHSSHLLQVLCHIFWQSVQQMLRQSTENNYEFKLMVVVLKGKPGDHQSLEDTSCGNHQWTKSIHLVQIHPVEK